MPMEDLITRIRKNPVSGDEIRLSNGWHIAVLGVTEDGAVMTELTDTLGTTKKLCFAKAEWEDPEDWDMVVDARETGNEE